MSERDAERAHQPIEKQVEEILQCRCWCPYRSAAPEDHSQDCPIRLRPAVLALLERREQEQLDGYKHFTLPDGSQVDLTKGGNEIVRYIESTLAYVRLDEAEWWADFCDLKHKDYYGAGSTRLAAHRVAVKQPELGPCGRHSKEFWVPCSMCEEIGPPNGKTGWPFKPNEGDPGHHDYNSEGGFVQPCTGHCTACAQEKAAPGGVSNVES